MPGCKICRARKVKCDGRPGRCTNCERLGLDCAGWSASLPASPAGSSQPPWRAHASSSASRGTAGRKRTYRSCRGCRAAKTRCDGGRPTCFRCGAKAIRCIFDAGTMPFWAQALSRDSGETRSPHGNKPPAPTAARDAADDHGPGDTPDPSERRDSDRIPVESLLSPGLPAPGGGNVSTSYPSLDGSSWDALSPLLSSELPETPGLLRRLVQHYFDNVHHLRCFAFVHKPSFMRQIDQGLPPGKEEAPLRYIICAHGAKYVSYTVPFSSRPLLPWQQFGGTVFDICRVGRFFALEYSVNVRPLPARLIHEAGNGWAKVAEGLLLASYGKISVPHLMAAVLLYDYQFRLGNYAQALMLSGLTVRMAHALQLNLEYTPADLEGGGGGSVNTSSSFSSLSTYAEARRRLMWACYVLDTWTGSGVDQLTLLHENDIKVRLPWNERSFRLQMPCVTTRLGEEGRSPPSGMMAESPAETGGMMSCYIHLIALWKRVARYVKHLDTAQPPWQPESEFTLLHADLGAWRAGLPASLDFSPESIYMRLESAQLGALALLHCTYHNAMCDFYRIAMPELFKLPCRGSAVFSPAAEGQRQGQEQTGSGFFADLQDRSLFHAQSMAAVLAGTARHGERFLADSMLPTLAYNANRVMLYYVARLLDMRRPGARALFDETIGWVRSNNRMLRIMAVTNPLAEPLSITTDRWLRKIRTGFATADSTAHIGPQDPSDINDTEWSSSAAPSPDEDTPDQILNPLSLYRLARKSVVGDKHDAVPSSSSSPSFSQAVGRLGNNNLMGQPTDSDMTIIVVENGTTSPMAQPRAPSWPEAGGTGGTHQSSSGIQDEHTIIGSASSDMIAPAPVPTSVPPWPIPHDDATVATGFVPGAAVDALDLDDLQSYLTWDLDGMVDLGADHTAAADDALGSSQEFF